jgi:hypothetical protein
MYLKTKVNVNGEGFYNEIAIGKMLAIDPKEDSSIVVSGEYRKEDETPIKAITKTYSAEEVEALYIAIKSGLTPNLNGVLAIWEQIYKAFQIEMASTFGITTKQIEICK